MSGILIWNVLGILTPVAFITLIVLLWRRWSRSGAARTRAESVVDELAGAADAGDPSHKPS